MSASRNRQSVTKGRIDPATRLPLDASIGSYSVAENGAVSLIGSRCRDCGWQSFPAAEVCVHCLSTNLASTSFPGEGVLYAETTVHVAPRPWFRPMRVGYVDLNPDIRVFTHLKDGVEIDDLVSATVDAVAQDEDGRSVVSFVFGPKRKVP